ncbi:Protein tssc1 [Gonapodya sp. JEL0774]|nr:Protein tssc1 [Gonapodya sp. JEL0774]
MYKPTTDAFTLAYRESCRYLEVTPLPVRRLTHPLPPLPVAPSRLLAERESVSNGVLDTNSAEMIIEPETDRIRVVDAKESLPDTLQEDSSAAAVTSDENEVGRVASASFFTPHLVAIDRGRNLTGLDGAQTVAEELGDVHVYRVEARGWPLPEGTVEALTNCVGESNGVGQVAFWNCALSDSDISHLGALSACLHSLTLDRIPLPDSLFTLLLPESSSLRHLTLRGNGIEDAGCSILCERLKGNKTLVTLNLSGNRLGKGAAEAIAEALKLNNTLMSLDLSWNTLADAAGTALAKAFASTLMSPEEAQRRRTGANLEAAGADDSSRKASKAKVAAPLKSHGKISGSNENIRAGSAGKSPSAAARGNIAKTAATGADKEKDKKPAPAVGGGKEDSAKALMGKKMSVNAGSTQSKGASAAIAAVAVAAKVVVGKDKAGKKPNVEKVEEEEDLFVPPSEPIYEFENQWYLAGNRNLAHLNISGCCAGDAALHSLLGAVKDQIAAYDALLDGMGGLLRIVCESAVHGIPNHTARCLAPLAAEGERSRFIVGTADRADNEIHLLDFEEDDFEISSLVFRHPRDIWAITPSPSRVDMLFTAFTNTDDSVVSMTSALWRMPTTEIDEQSKFRHRANLELEEVVRFDSRPQKPTHIGGILCDPSSPKTDTVVTLEERNLHIWKTDVGSSTAQLVRTIDADPHPLPDIPSQLNAGVWNPHSAEQVFSACGIEVSGWDIRSGMIWSVAFNKSHDQLLLTSSSDCQVNLHNVVSISSAPFGDSEESSEDEADEAGGENTNGESKVAKDEDPEEKSDREAVKRTNKLGDALVTTYDQHEESVYSVAWSPADPWIFASLSYDGRVVINLVPSFLKYQILL